MSRLSHKITTQETEDLQVSTCEEIKDEWMNMAAKYTACQLFPEHFALMVTLNFTKLSGNTRVHLLLCPLAAAMSQCCEC